MISFFIFRKLNLIIRLMLKRVINLEQVKKSRKWTPFSCYMIKPLEVTSKVYLANAFFNKSELNLAVRFPQFLGFRSWSFSCFGRERKLSKAQNWICNIFNVKDGILYLLEKWRPFVSPKTLLCSRVRVEAIGNMFSVKHIFEQV